LLLGGFVLFLTAYVGATAYLIYRDDLFETAVARQSDMQHTYEARIAALRSEIDRITSRHAVTTEGVEEQLAALLAKQDVIERRQTALDDLVERAEASGVEMASAPRLPRTRPETQAAPVPDTGEPEPLAYAPAVAAVDEMITGALLRGSEGESRSIDGDMRPILGTVGSSLARTEDQQGQALDSLAQAAQAEADRLSAALEPIGIEVDDPEEQAADPEGGPYIPAGGLHFVERAVMLDRTLDDIEALRKGAEAMPLVAPVAAERISSRFGFRRDPFLHRPAFHAGLDFVAPAGTEVRATAPGTVVSAGWDSGYGNLVEIRHAGGVSTRYGHLSKILVSEGEEIAAGTPVGRVGSTGRSTGPHLHYETRREGKAVNPVTFLSVAQALRRE
jgi:murein DD-endopeptidase MepM/ murein hydrolase activator NlpD